MTDQKSPVAGPADAVRPLTREEPDRLAAIEAHLAESRESGSSDDDAATLRENVAWLIERLRVSRQKAKPAYPAPASDAERQEFARELVRNGLTVDEATTVAGFADAAVRPYTTLAEIEVLERCYQPWIEREYFVDNVSADDLERLLATARASVEAQEYKDAANAYAKQLYGISYDELRQRIEAVQRGEYVTHEQVMAAFRSTRSGQRSPNGETK